MKKTICFLSTVLFALLLSGCTSGSTTNTTNTTGVVNTINQAVATANENSNASVASDTDKVCGWVNKSDVIMKLNFADGVAKDTSYEAGFYLSEINLFARLARKECDYRTGFSYEELKGKGAVQLGVRGYTDSNRRQLANEPLSVVIGADGHPNIGSAIEVTVLD
ncbi:MAG: hypothetical protein WCV85_02920 [Patescibacteria group bacterium]|jgi:hypothetical protein